MEAFYKHDFSQVRIHADSRAGDSARAVSARAYTVGQNIVFGSGEYAPETSEGRKLLVHELAHTIQQTDKPTHGLGTLRVGDHDGASEHEAEAAVNSFAQQPSFSLKARANIHLARVPAAAGQKTRESYWHWVRSDLRDTLTARGITGSEDFFSDSGKTLKFISLIVRLDDFGIWPFIAAVTNTWFGISVFGLGFTPTNGVQLLAHLKATGDLLTDIFPNWLHAGATWSFRDKAAANSLHITGNSHYQAHMDTFNPMLLPIGTIGHFFADVIPSLMP